jgi:secondary thiamine-phosphate synthase enzyme
MSTIKRLTIKTARNRQVIDITDEVQRLVDNEARFCVVFVAHTTCAVTTADLDPGTDLDLLDAVWEMIPKLQYRHPHNPAHVPAHLASSIIGPSVSIPLDNGSLMLGTWQRIIVVELDGPRERTLIVSSSSG